MIQPKTHEIAKEMLSEWRRYRNGAKEYRAIVFADGATPTDQERRRWTECSYAKHAMSFLIQKLFGLYTDEEKEQKLAELLD
jgi:putative SOS response-associated peptidase YedK